MKTLKTIILGLALLVAGSTAFAAQAPELTKTDVLNMYVDALVHGKISGVDDILDKDVKQTLRRGEKQFRLDKKQILESLKAQENIEQGCTFNTLVVEENEKEMVVKITMKYDGYTRTNLVTIASKKADSKITKIETLS
jgi:hypothetical protein